MICNSPIKGFYLLTSLFLSSVFLGISTVSTRAEDQGPTGTTIEEEPVRVDFSIYTWNQRRFYDQDPDDHKVDRLPDLFFRSGEEIHSIQLRRGQKTGTFQYEGFSPLVLYTESGRNEMGEPTFRRYASINFEHEADRVVILLFPHMRDSDRLARAIAIDPDEARFRPDVPIFHNLSNRELALRYNENTRRLPPYGSVAIEADPDGKRLQLSIATRRDGDWEVVSRTSMTTAPGARMMILLESDGRGDHWSIRRIPLD